MIKRLVPIILATAIICLLVALLFFRESLLQRLRFSRTETGVSATLSLEQIRDIAELQTISGVYRVVFPHDFYLPDVNISGLLDKLKGPSGLSPAEALHLSAYNLALDTGFALYREETRFVVLTAVVIAGYQLSQDDQILKVGENGPVMYLPEAQILDIQIEDMHRESYPYPAIPLSPGELRKVAVFVRNHVESLSAVDDLREKAREQAKLLFSSLFAPLSSETLEFSSETLATTENF